MLAEPDRKQRSMQQFLAEIPIAPDVSRRWFRKIQRVTDYQIAQPASGPNQTVVPVHVTTPDLMLWERMLGGRSSAKEMVQAAAEKELSNGLYPILRYSDYIVLVKEGRDWHVVAGYEVRERLARLRGDALQAYHAYQYDRAVDLYRQMQGELDKAAFTGSGYLKYLCGAETRIVAAAQSSAPGARVYLSRVILEHVEAKLTAAHQPGMFGQISNAGERSLDQVELTVSYYAGAGNQEKAVYSESHTPIATPLRFTDFDRPILPFLSGETRQFGFTLNAPANIQQQSRSEVRVSNIIFSPPDDPEPSRADIPSAGSGQAPGRH